MIFLLLFALSCLAGSYSCEELSNENCTSQLDGRKELIQYYLEHATDLDAPIQNNETLLMLAVRHGLKSLVEDILAQNVTLDIQNDKNLTALMMADDLRNHQIANVIRLHAYPDLYCPINIEVWDIRYAAGMGDLQKLELLLSCGVNPNYRNADTTTVLMEIVDNPFLAKKNLTLPIVSLLLENNASVDLQDKEGRTALFFLAENHWKDSSVQDLSNDVAGKLLEYTPQLDLHDKSGNTALHYAALKGQANLAEILVQYEHEQLSNQTGNFSIINARNEEGSTPLMLAASKGWDKVVKVLIDSHTATLDTKDKDGRTAMMLAADNYEFHSMPFSQVSNENSIKTLLQAGANPNIQDKEGKTALMYAAIYKGFMKWSAQENITGKEEMVRILLKNNASTKLKDKAGKSVFDYAEGLGKMGGSILSILYKETTDTLFGPLQAMLEKNTG